VWAIDIRSLTPGPAPQPVFSIHIDMVALDAFDQHVGVSRGRQHQEGRCEEVLKIGRAR
jgi:hypothetical protein